jgi:hypothetical protein
MIHVIIIVVMVNPEPDPLSQEFHEIYARQREELQQRIEDAQRNMIQVVCDRCNREVGWYPTPGRAKMGLSAHQHWCGRDRQVLQRQRDKRKM